MIQCFCMNPDKQKSRSNDWNHKMIRCLTYLITILNYTYRLNLTYQLYLIFRSL
uniref:Uncharacterized protein n=1 Tax=Human betaherpesvirus 6A TaxID=32603 RepID=A0A2L2Q8M6_9BETA|nr:hypothetical protein [Human betaherpesvirus 6A]AVI07642.1 hypothetical protein [Human betaherpesvirus 6A]AVI07763.1 hypothetical protein [Human betaherpesvirus 6A]AVI07883.1 hypothetical protein [Human betaherpesvirus 6A]AVI08011.1 hypothetical protein [Human betaherpesvirus 6A]